jgi:chloride channel protein, CIC family
MIPPILARRSAANFWLAVVLTGIGTGLSAAALTALLQLTQRHFWGGDGVDLLQGASRASPIHHLIVLTGAGLLTGAGQLLLTRLSSGNSIDISAAIWFHAGRLPKLRTLGSAVLSIILVGMGAALGREGAPKQAGAVVGNAVADRTRLTDEERRLLVACGAGAGMAAAYGVPVGGALFALEVLRGMLALRFVLPAMVTCLVATGISWSYLPDAPIYDIPAYHGSISVAVWALLAGPVVALVSVVYVRAVAFADRHKPTGWRRLLAPVLALTALGAASIPYPQLLGNGRDAAQLAFTGQIGPLLLLILFVLRPAATLICMGSGAPGGLFTPTLTMGAMLGGVLGLPWSSLWPGIPPGLFALLGATAMIAATTQGPISAVVLMMEMTGYSRAAMLPMLIIVATATLVARTIEPRSVYDARLSDAEVAQRQRARDQAG